jgi:hypothetical protein
MSELKLRRLQQTRANHLRATIARVFLFLVLTVALSSLMALPYLFLEPQSVSIALN